MAARRLPAAPRRPTTTSATFHRPAPMSAFGVSVVLMGMHNRQRRQMKKSRQDRQHRAGRSGGRAQQATWTSMAQELMATQAIGESAEAAFHGWTTPTSGSGSW